MRVAGFEPATLSSGGWRRRWSTRSTRTFLMPADRLDQMDRQPERPEARSSYGHPPGAAADAVGCRLHVLGSEVRIALHHGDGLTRLSAGPRKSLERCASKGRDSPLTPRRARPDFHATNVLPEVVGVRHAQVNASRGNARNLSPACSVGLGDESGPCSLASRARSSHGFDVGGVSGS